MSDWKTIPGYSNYEVSHLGEIRSLSREKKFKNGRIVQFESKIIRDSNDIKLLFPGKKGMTYQLQISNDLESWITLEKLIIGNGSILSEEIPILDASSNYYRVITQIN